MKQKLYIGALELCFEENVIPNLRDFDSKFLTPVLPVERSVSISAETVDNLQIPEGPCQTVGTRRAWWDGEREIRVYNPLKGEPFLMSIRQGDTVRLVAERERWQKFKDQIRPWFNIHIEELLLDTNAVILHSAGIIVNGKAILFTAPAGTGKTTQTNLWHQYAQGVEDLNGDRAVLQKTDDGWRACGFPIYGSVQRCNQCAVPIDAIVVIRQGRKDRVRELSVMEKVSLLYSQTTVPALDSSIVSRTMDLIEDLVSQVRVLRLDCTMEETAVRVLQNYLWGESNDGTISD